MSYREKVYKFYSTQRHNRLSPLNTDGFQPRAPYLKMLIKKHFPEDKKANILELGCGHGAFQYYIQQAGYSNSIAIDCSPEQVREAHRLGLKDVILCDIGEYLKSVKAGSVDFIILFDVLEHFNKEEISGLVDEFYRVLTVNGKVLAHVPNAEGFSGNFMRQWDFTHEIAFTRQSIAQIFISSGFSSISVYEDKPVPHGLASFFRYVLWELGVRQIFKLFRIIETGGCDPNAVFSQNFLAVVRK